MRKLEAKYQDSLVVIGVHSGKYHAERVTANITAACARLEVEHPVVNDRQFRVWRSFAVNAWPTLTLIDPQGYVLAQEAGEFLFEQLDPVVGNLVEQYATAGTLDRRPVHFTRPRPVPSDGLRFPTKVLADPAGGRLFIADHGHNRVLVVARDGPATARVTAVIGSGTRGLADGSFAQAQFDHPNGLALAGETLYIADTENHSLRAVDLAAQTVTTLAGTGVIGYRRSGGPARETPLNSPWDLWAQDGTLYIAMAGTHQLWTLDLAGGTVAPFAGTGREAIRDAPRSQAELAQPMGLTGEGTRLYFVCAETQAVRQIDRAAEPDAPIRTLVGTDLFDFGDVEGRNPTVRLQHCQGIAAHAGQLYVADTYNSKIKRVDPATGVATTWLGKTTPRSGETPPRGWVDDPVAAAIEFDEPAGLGVGDGHLYIADTNNHRIVVADLATRAAQPLDLTGI